MSADRTRVVEGSRESVEAPFAEKVTGGTFAVARLWSPPAGASRANAMTCDIEDYFQVSAFESAISYDSWNRLECRIPRNVERILRLMSDAGAKGTFFTLGWVAEQLPAVVRTIVDEGHEIASHGMRHRCVWSQTPDQFREDATRAKQLLEDVSGTRVRGYRAASWSLDSRTPWAHQILAEAGYEYSSSVYPIAHDHYGVPGAPTRPFLEASSGMLEIPASTVKLGGRNWPAAGGGYFRFWPLPVSLWLLERASRAVPALFYFHPWEIDPDQPRVQTASRRARFRHYLNLEKFEARFKALLDKFAWDRVDSVFLSAVEHPNSSNSYISS